MARFNEEGLAADFTGSFNSCPLGMFWANYIFVLPASFALHRTEDAISYFNVSGIFGKFFTAILANSNFPWLPAINLTPPLYITFL